MARLYELFVAEWLKAHLPSDVILKVQEKVEIGKGQALMFKIDLVLYDRASGKALCVLDTKYKVNESRHADDVAKVVAYAEMKECTKAILVYPTPLQKPVNASSPNIKVRSMTFALAGDLEESGKAFLRGLLQAVQNPNRGE
jgi:5-methylcytosine-specific restriction enzyme subunit McrC